MDAVTNVPQPVNEPVHDYAPGSPERQALSARLEEMAAEHVELAMTIDGEHRMGGGDPIDVVQPHNHKAQLGTMRDATADDVRQAVAAAKAAAPAWQHMSFDDRAAIVLKAADLLAGPWRYTLNAATMLGQSKTCYQAEIDTPCELVDFWRFNVYFARQLIEQQPISGSGVWNRLDHRPLEGFVLAVTPFNFTAIAGNLSTAPALMGNTVVWKPAVTQQLAAHYTLQLLEAAGLPPGVINLVTGTGQAVSEVAVGDPELAGIHFTGSTATFGKLWDAVAGNLRAYRAYPRLVGETGGKDFVVAHPSADLDVLRTALVRGGFEYQGQKCSAASRAYVPDRPGSRVRLRLHERGVASDSQHHLRLRGALHHDRDADLPAGGHPRLVLDEPRRATAPGFAKVDEHGTPQRVTWIAGVGAAFLAGVFPIRQVADLTNIGILSAFVVVCVAVIFFRYTRPDAPRTFRLPLMPVVPAFGVLASLFLILQLQWQTWVRFAVWLVIGLIIYFAYGRKHSLLSPDSPLHTRTPSSGT